MTSSGDILAILRGRLGSSAIGSETKKPFRFFLCGDPALVSELRTTLLSGHGAESIPLDAAATLETIDPNRPLLNSAESRCIIFLGRPGDLGGARLDLLAPLELPIFAVTVAPELPSRGPAAPPGAGQIGEYELPSLERALLRQRLFPHIVERCKGVEVAVGRRLPALRESVAARLTR
ncbi:MAG TPA: hypothetical protein VKG44_03805, partial [Candidatus Baltobacteraceae bacterium]|nr:hypothetical protein [Candidatus Baltobacteraceae bacterium]